MSTDREVLELAAKAAGIKLHRWLGDLQNRYLLDPDFSVGIAVTWNPLTDDGDALALALSVGLVVDTKNARAIAYDRLSAGHNDWVYGDEDGDFDEDDAVRRAIVFAAADIGRSIP
jgi:hypothetical protein